MWLISRLFLLSVFMPLVWSSSATAWSSASSKAWANARSEQTIVRVVHCNCTKDYDPVCGSNGVSYSNECLLDCINKDHVKNGRECVHLLHRGRCHTLPCSCPQIYAPVCGTNNQTYPNNCYLNCENTLRTERGIPRVDLAYRDACKRTACSCPNNTIPVCGSDNLTYKNLCFLQCVSREKESCEPQSITLKHIGPCKNETCHCSLTEEQICASDGHTYYNKCAFDCQNRRQKQLGLEELTFEYPGSCIRCVCFHNNEPVCGSDWNTYPSFCLFLCNNRIRRRQGLPELVARWRGPCDCGCSLTWEPVCADNHVTWPNLCALNCENKKRNFTCQPRLTVAHKGQCKPCN